MWMDSGSLPRRQVAKRFLDRSGTAVAPMKLLTGAEFAVDGIRWNGSGSNWRAGTTAVRILARPRDADSSWWEVNDCFTRETVQEVTVLATACTREFDVCTHRPSQFPTRSRSGTVSDRCAPELERSSWEASGLDDAFTAVCEQKNRLGCEDEREDYGRDR